MGVKLHASKVNPTHGCTLKRIDSDRNSVELSKKTELPRTNPNFFQILNREHWQFNFVIEAMSVEGKAAIKLLTRAVELDNQVWSLTQLYLVDFSQSLYKL